MARTIPKTPTIKPLSSDEKTEREQLIESIRTKLDSAERNFYTIGAELGVINKKRLYRAEGTFEHFVRKHFGFSRRRAYVLMEIARKFAPERAVDGESKLRAGLEYLRTTPEQDRPVDLGRIDFEVPDGKKPSRYNGKMRRRMTSTGRRGFFVGGCEKKMPASRAKRARFALRSSARCAMLKSDCDSLLVTKILPIS